jgi:hypothetical protein
MPSRAAIIEAVPRSKKPRRRRSGDTPDDPLDAYRRVRKPVPPPARIDEDRRRRLEEQEAERRIRELE